MTFDFSIGGYFSDNNIDVFYRKRELYCKKSFAPGAPTEKVYAIFVNGHPAWEELLQFLENCKWQPVYDSGALDGIQWTLSAYRKERFKLECYGSNAYPSDFKKFIKLLNKLLAEVNLKVDF